MRFTDLTKANDRSVVGPYYKRTVDTTMVAWPTVNTHPRVYCHFGVTSRRTLLASIGGRSVSRRIALHPSHDFGVSQTITFSTV